MSAGPGEGRRRARMVLCGLSGLGCAVAMALVLVVYGAPYEATWWWVMAAILAAAIFLPAFLVPLGEWVVEGYRRQDDG